MFITITTSKVTKEQSEAVDKFLSGFLPRLTKEQPGVIAAYHFNRPDKGDDITFIIWESEEAIKAYRQGELIKLPMEFEKIHNLPSTREAYPITVG
jgi:heme-degrading monooxygenase HmoA